MAFVLQAHNAGLIGRDGFDIFRALQQALGLELFTSQADHHHLAAKVRVEGDIVDGPDGHDGCRGVNRHAAAVKVVQADHAVHVRVFRQQIAFDNFHHVIHYARHAVYAGGNAEQVFGADAAVRIAIAFEGIAFQRGKRLRHAGCQGQRIQRRGFR